MKDNILAILDDLPPHKTLNKLKPYIKEIAINWIRELRKYDSPDGSEMYKPHPTPPQELEPFYYADSEFPVHSSDNTVRWIMYFFDISEDDLE